MAYDELAELNRKIEEMSMAPTVYRACHHYPDCLALKGDPCAVYDEAKKAYLQCNIHLTEMEHGIQLTDQSAWKEV